MNLIAVNCGCLPKATARGWGGGWGGLGGGEAVVALMPYPWGEIIRQYFFLFFLKHQMVKKNKKTRENSLASIIYPANGG